MTTVTVTVQHVFFYCDQLSACQIQPCMKQFGHEQYCKESMCMVISQAELATFWLIQNEQKIVPFITGVCYVIMFMLRNYILNCYINLLWQETTFTLTPELADNNRTRCVSCCIQTFHQRVKTINVHKLVYPSDKWSSPCCNGWWEMSIWPLGNYYQPRMRSSHITKKLPATVMSRL